MMDKELVLQFKQILLPPESRSQLNDDSVAVSLADAVYIAGSLDSEDVLGDDVGDHERVAVGLVHASQLVQGRVHERAADDQQEVQLLEVSLAEKLGHRGHVLSGEDDVRHQDGTALGALRDSLLVDLKMRKITSC